MADEKKYIEQGAALDAVFGQFCASSDETERALNAAIEEIRAIPAADAIEELIPFKKQVEKGMGLLDKADELLNAVKPRWIPVAERLPEHEYGESTSVLTVDLYGVMRVTYFNGGNWCWPTGEALTTMRVAPITHWMPLPKPPMMDEGDTNG